MVELLIVVLLLGILSSVVVFSVRGVAHDGTVTACAADRRQLATAAEAYAAAHGGELATESELVTAGLLRGDSELWDVVVIDGTDYTISPATGSDCVDDTSN